jgi:predicted GNAT family acetyltransferase
MPVIRHTDPDAFLAAAQPMLARSEASAAFFRSFALGLKRHPPIADERVYCATYCNGEQHGAAVQRADRGVVVEDSDPEAAAAFADDLAREWSGLQGVGGALPACAAFARRWHLRTGRGHVLRAHLRHHVLTEVALVPAVPGRMRRAMEDDLPWLADAAIEFLDDARMPDDPARVRNDVPKFQNEGRFRIWDDAGPVAYAGWTDAGDAFARVGPVYTSRPCRRRGYATGLVAQLSRELIANGKRRIFLVTDLANPTSNAIYARIGFRALTDFCHFDFVSATAAE